MLTKRYVHGLSTDTPLVSYTGSAVGTTNRQFLHRNHQGSVIAITNNGGNVIDINTYDAYGVPASGNSGRFGYTGQIYLKELGLYYYRARVYHPDFGRFMQTDPIGYEDQMNLYAYVNNDPANSTDPSGMQAQARSLGYVIYEYFWGKGSDEEKAERTKKFNEGQLQAFVLIGKVSPYGTVIDGVRTINEAIHGENIVDNVAGMAAGERLSIQLCN